jgi:tetratricopeptide (TPR) repeat protein
VGRILILVLVVAAASSAWAQDAADEARDAFMQGKTQYNLGKFEVALEHFSRAYELKPAPLLLFNLGQCHRQLKNHERAIFFLDGYLREDPDTSDRELVQGLIEEQQRLLAEQQAAAPPASPTMDPSPEAEPEAEAEGAWVPWAIGGGVAVAVAAVGVAAAIALTPQGRQEFPAPTLGEVDLR